MSNNRKEYKRDITGMRFGQLQVVKRTDIKNYDSYVWVCKCSCGNYINTTRSNLIKGDITRCNECAKIVRVSTGNNLYSELMSKFIVEGTNIKMIQSKKLGTRNKSGVKGVCWDKSKRRWEASIGFKGKKIKLGRFKNIEDAKKAREEAEKKYFTPFIENFYKNKND